MFPAVFISNPKDNKYYYGTVYTSNNSADLNGESYSGTILCLDPIAKYHIRIHDSKYYLMAGKPLVFPEIFKQYEVR